MKTYTLDSFTDYWNLVRFLTFTLIILTALPGCTTKRESPVELYKEAETLQKEAEDFYEKRDYDSALSKYHEAIEKAKESAKSDWNLPNFVIEKCEKGITLVDKKAKEQGLVYYDNTRYITVEELDRILKEKNEKEGQERLRKEAEAERLKEQEAEQQKKEAEGKRLKEQQEEERHKKEVEAKQLREEEERAKELKKIKTTISGGAWVIRGSGTSDILRGLDIYLCKSELLKSEIGDLLQQLADKFKSEEGQCERLAAQSDYSSDSQQKDAKGYKEAYELVQLLRERTSVSLLEIYALTIVTNKSSFSNEFTFMNTEADTILPKFVVRAMVASTKTDIDGKYQIENVTGGEYVLYAISMSSFSIIDWMIPVEIKENGNIKIDLYNQNAGRIINKSD